MTVEMTAVAFDGTYTAERELSNLHVSRMDPWVSEVATLEHHNSGRYSMKATNPVYGDEDHVGAGLAIGGGTGLLLGLIGGPLGMLFLGALGAAAGGAIGAATPGDGAGALEPLVDEVKDALPPGSSALILVAESPTAEQLVSAVGPTSRQVIREQLTQEQVDQLKQAAVRH